MPTSHYKIISHVMGVFDRIGKVNSVLDIGVGFGKYGVLLREHLEVRLKRYDKKDWLTQIDAVEIWPEYINPIYRHVYNCIFICDAVVAMSRIQNYDVILLLEVLEHLPKRRGTKLINLLLKKYNKALIISFPEIYKEGACSDWDNPYEEHRCLWTFEELKAIASKTEQISKTVFYISK